MIELKQQSATATPDTSIEDFETYCGLVAESQRGILWWLGDLALMAERRWPNTWNQVFPIWVSPDHIARCKAVSAAYKPEERNLEATWAVHMQNAKRPDRVAVVAAHVAAGHTSDEARKNPQPSTAVKTDWLLAVDVNYFIHSYFHSGSVRAAAQFDEWLDRLLRRLQKHNNLTDVVCCLDSKTSFRKRLTEGWEHPYKPRVEKQEELYQQLNLAPTLLRERGLACVSMDDMEADDLLASYAVQFPGNVTLLTGDKDMRQCLKTGKCNILHKVEWNQNEETGDWLPKYTWISERSHIDDGAPYASTLVKGITPEQWNQFQAIAGDKGDGVDGCNGIGAIGARDLIKAHGTVSGVIAAAESGLIALTEKKRQAVLEFASVADVMLQLVTLKTDLSVPMITKLSLKETV